VCYFGICGSAEHFLAIIFEIKFCHFGPDRSFKILLACEDQQAPHPTSSTAVKIEEL
jgi:hypothetical protein